MKRDAADEGAGRRRRRDARPRRGRRRSPPAGTPSIGARPRPSSTSPTRAAVEDAIAELRPRRGRQLRRLDRRRRRRGRRARRDARSTTPRAGIVAGDGRGAAARACSTSPATTSSTARKGSAYVESDLPGAISAYGRSKQAGETSVAIANPRHFIVRSSWLFGAGGPNFVETMLRVGGEQPEVIVVSDQVGEPDLHAAPRPGARAADRERRLRHPPHRRRRALLVVRVRAGDLRPGRARRAG